MDLSASAIAQKAWVLENNIVAVDGAGPDSIYFYDEAAQRRALEEKPWAGDRFHFRRVKISAVALLKMVIHARSGGIMEVMGFLQGRIDGDAFVVMDAFAIPVEGTASGVDVQTGVDAQTGVYEYMVEYSQTNKKSGRLENVVGWYHSHQGYGSLLYGFDVSTQMRNQQYQEPFFAVVIDPTRTASAGKVEIGAFRTYPPGHKSPDEPISEYQSMLLEKIKVFKFDSKQFYALDITYFKSSLDCHLLDLLWKKYWVNTLSSSPFLGNKDYVAGRLSDLAENPKQAGKEMAHFRWNSVRMSSKRKKEALVHLRKLPSESSRITAEQVHALMSQVIKNILFNSDLQSRKVFPNSTDSPDPEPMDEV